MMQARRFLFDVSFDTPGEPQASGFEAFDAMSEANPGALALPEPVPVAAIDVEALSAARAEGIAEGRRLGRAEAGEIASVREAAALDAVAERLLRLIESTASLQHQMSEQAALLALAVARRMAPALSRASGFGEIEAVVREGIRHAIDEPRLVVRVSDAFFEAARARLEPLAAQAGYAGRLIILADPGLGLTDCSAEWADGGIERDTARLWSDIEAAMSRALGDVRHGKGASNGGTSSDGAPGDNET